MLEGELLVQLHSIQQQRISTCMLTEDHPEVNVSRQLDLFPSRIGLLLITPTYSPWSMYRGYIFRSVSFPTGTTNYHTNRPTRYN